MLVHHLISVVFDFLCLQDGNEFGDGNQNWGYCQVALAFLLSLIYRAVLLANIGSLPTEDSKKLPKKIEINSKTYIFLVSSAKMSRGKEQS